MTTENPQETVEQNDELVEEIAEMFEESFGGDTDPEDLADDAFMRFMREASDACGLEGVERDDRPDVIMAGIRRQMERSLEEGLQDIRWQVELMFNL